MKTLSGWAATAVGPMTHVISICCASSGPAQIDGTGSVGPCSYGSLVSEPSNREPNIALVLLLCDAVRARSHIF